MVEEGATSYRCVYSPVGKIAEKAVCRCVFLNMALYFECRINKKHTPSVSDCFLAILKICDPMSSCSSENLLEFQTLRGYFFLETEVV